MKKKALKQIKAVVGLPFAVLLFAVGWVCYVLGDRLLPTYNNNIYIKKMQTKLTRFKNVRYFLICLLEK